MQDHAEGWTYCLFDGDEKENLFWNIPIANTTVILLGSGTSVTQAAMRLLSSAGVLVGFCGGGATPLFAGTEVEWLKPQSEYRPTEYVQGWLSFWFDEKKRLAVAKEFQKKRIRFLQTVWDKDNELADEGFLPMMLCQKKRFPFLRAAWK